MGERYELRRVLRRGGVGVVFEAYDRVLDQAIALKIVRAEYAGDRAWAERLAREVKLARQINHQNVCRVYDIGVADRHPFLTMELATRGTLRDEIASGEYAARPLDDRLADARAIAAGLAAIHAAGIIHRDVSPQNVLRMADGSLVLSDFGLATDRFDGTSSVQGGTVAYMAPEVVRGARASMASDIWSLAVVIHEIALDRGRDGPRTGRICFCLISGGLLYGRKRPSFRCAERAWPKLHQHVPAAPPTSRSGLARACRSGGADSGARSARPQRSGWWRWRSCLLLLTLPGVLRPAIR